MFIAKIIALLVLAFFYVMMGLYYGEQLQKKFPGLDFHHVHNKAFLIVAWLPLSILSLVKNPTQFIRGLKQGWQAAKAEHEAELQKAKVIR